MVNNLPANTSDVGDLDMIPGLGRSPGKGNGNLLQYSCLENPMDGGIWWATIHRVAKSQTRLSDFTFTFTFIDWLHPEEGCVAISSDQRQGEETG